MTNGEPLILDTPEAIQAYRLLVLRSGLKLEIKGIRMSRGKSVYGIIKQEFKLKGSRDSVLAQFEEILRMRGLLQ